jgi:septum site-determining protein MinC
MSDLVQGGMFTVMVVRIEDPSDPSFESQLAERVARSPSFFANAPVVLDLRDCSGLANADALVKMRQLFRRQHLMLVGIQNGNATQIRAAMNADLAAFPPSGSTKRPEPPRAEAAAAASAPPHHVAAAAPQAAATPVQGRTKLVTHPVRSGTQIYARGGDLIVMNAVSAGAEVIADGNLHVYGTLRGRAIAGASGDAEARIFVDKLEAELICIAGHYLVSEAVAPEFRGQSVQIALVDDRLEIART